MSSNQIIEQNSKELLTKLANLNEEELSLLIRYHNEKYFMANEPEISDEAFDKLVEALKFLNPLAPVLSEIGSLANKFGVEVFGGHVVHNEPMLSLDKCYDELSFAKWAEKIKGDLIAMPKIDGVACSIIYRPKGEIKIAATRGDGAQGENVTNNALQISDLPKYLDAKKIADVIKDEQLEIRGEVYLPLSRFLSEYAKDFANPRNLAAGALKLKDSSKSKQYGLKFFPYDIRGTTISTEQEKFRLLSSLGFFMMPWWLISDHKKAIEIFIEVEKNRQTFDYEIDGVVYRTDLISEQLRLGETAHHPKFAIAYKFQGESAQTELLAVEWSIARTGVITPVAIVKPVFVSGASVSRASLHNFGLFNKKGLCEYSLVEINRRGGVIPHLERVLSKKGQMLQSPQRCPSCNGEVVIDGDFLKCAAPNQCEEVVVAKLYHFCQSLGIEGLGDKIVRKLYEADLLHKFGDVFRLTITDLMQIERMGEVLAKKLIDEISDKRQISLTTFIMALGIPEIGKNVSELIAANFHTIDQVLKTSKEDLLSLHGVGERIADSLINGFFEMREEISDLLALISINSEDKNIAGKNINHPLFDKKVVFTGKMAHLDRKSAQKLVKECGGKAPGAVSSSIDYLVIGDEASALLGSGEKSSKHKLGEKLIGEGSNLKIISESEFLKLCEK